MMMKGKLMKLFNLLLVGFGFFAVLSTVGASDFYDVCRAAADCVAGEPMNIGEILFRCSLGVALISWGVLNELKVKI